MSEVAFIIPARGGSKRLKRKNILPVLGKPMLLYAIEACMRSEHYTGFNVFVSTEDPEIKGLAESVGANVIDRPQELSEDNVWTQEVLKHAIRNFSGIPDPDIIVRIQANSPQIENDKIDACIRKLVSNQLWEVFTVDKNGIEDAAIHVMKRQCVDQAALSVYKGVVFTDYIDVHTIEDIKNVSILMKEKAHGS